MSATNHKPSLDARIVNPIVSATTDVLGTMASTKATLKEVHPQHDYVPSGDISAIIGILGQDGEGMVALSFSNTMANLIVSRLLGVPVADITPDDRCDGIGELVNMISGNAKTALSQDSTIPYKLTLPTIILGSNHEVARRPKSPYLILSFEADGQTFTVQLSFKTYN
jgi:chemotaxis protein CheX